MKKSVIILLSVFLLVSEDIFSQQVYDLQGCLRQALENNHNIRKSKLDLEKSAQARNEILGALLPQVNATGSMNYNIQKSKFIMPNFINSMLPPNMQDPNAAQYMTIEMGMNYSAALGASVNQQVVNFSLFNALDIAKTAENLTALAVESKEEDVISQTAGIFYGVQVTDYAVGLFSQSIGIIDTMLNTMKVSYENGLIKKVDLDRLTVTRTNLATQKTAMQNAVEVQKNLLKLQMGIDINQPLEIQKLDLTVFERQAGTADDPDFDLKNQTAYKILDRQSFMTQLQKRSAIYESLPVLTAMGTFNYNGVSEEFFRGETNYWYPTSMVGLSMKIPIFGGLSRTAKIRQADIELRKVSEDKAMLEQSLNMAFSNALIKLSDSRRTIDVQRANMALAGEVYRVSEANYAQGLASMSDVLNANNSLIQSQMSYADALNNYMKAWIELRKASGTIKSLVSQN